jgi:hypothetical protein
MLTAEITNKIYSGVIENIFHIEKREISKLLWLFTMIGKENINNIHKKMEIIIEGGLKDFMVKDICIVVWSMCVANYN